MRVANSVAAFAALVWTVLFFEGVKGVYGVIDQHAAGYPNVDQVRYYLALPGFVSMALLALGWVFNGIRRWPYVLTLISAAALAALVPYLLFYGGGV